MFQSTLRHRDPEAWVRWVVAVLLVGLAAGAVAVSVGLVAVLKMLWTLLLLLLGRGPAPQQTEFIHLVIEEVEFEELDMEEQEWNLDEPSELIGEAPAPPAPEPVVERVAALDPLPMARSEVMLNDAKVMGVLGALEGAGAFEDLLRDSDLSLGGVGGLEVGITVRTGEGSRVLGSGGGGAAVGVGTLGGGGGALVERAGGSSATLGGLGTRGASNRVRAWSAQLPAGETARCVVKVDPAGTEPLHVRGCAESLWADARAAVRIEGLDRRPATVRVTVTGTGE